jgi:hypothetical protein
VGIVFVLIAKIISVNGRMGIAIGLMTTKSKRLMTATKRPPYPICKISVQDRLIDAPGGHEISIGRVHRRWSAPSGPRGGVVTNRAKGPEENAMKKFVLSLALPCLLITCAGARADFAGPDTPVIVNPDSPHPVVVRMADTMTNTVVLHDGTVVVIEKKRCCKHRRENHEN